MSKTDLKNILFRNVIGFILATCRFLGFACTEALARNDVPLDARYIERTSR